MPARDGAVTSALGRGEGPEGLPRSPPPSAFPLVPTTSLGGVFLLGELAAHASAGRSPPVSTSQRREGSVAGGACPASSSASQGTVPRLPGFRGGQRGGEGRAGDFSRVCWQFSLAETATCP